MFCLIAAACLPVEDVQFGPPSFLSVESQVNGRTAVILRCTLSDARVESCGFMYGEGEEFGNKVECMLNGNCFEAVITDVTPGVVYGWCAFVRAGESEIRSESGTFRLSATSRLPPTGRR